MHRESEWNIFCLDEAYSTTQRVTKKKTEIADNPGAGFKSLLSLPEGDKRRSEGGLRTKGFFKQSLSDKPLVTIITVVLNGEKYLEETIQSVLKQSYNNVEYIVIDGGSSDGTVDIIKKYDDKIDYWVSEKDKGIYHAMNKGVSVATGEILGIINSDDWLEPDSIEKVADVSSTIQEDEFVVHGKIALYDANDNFLTDHSPKKFPGYHLFSTPFKHPAMFVSMKLYQQIGLYDKNCGLAADYDLMLRMIANGSKSVFIDKVLTNVRLVGISTGGSSEATNKELLFILKRNTGSRFQAYLALFVRSINKMIIRLKP